MTTDFRHTGKYYSILASKAEMIAERMGSATDLDTVYDICCDQDWPEGDAHQVWLDEANPGEIADWALSVISAANS